MAETVTTTIPIAETSPAPGDEIGYDGGLVRGLKVLGECANSLLGQKLPMCIHDILDPAEYPLTTSDPLHIAGTYREWQVKTPSYLGITTSSNRLFVVQVYIRKTSGTLQYRLYQNGSTATTYTITSAVLTPQWLTLGSTIGLADTAESIRIGLGLITYNGGVAASNYVSEVRIYPAFWSNIANQNNGWVHPVTSGRLAPVPVSFIDAWSGCHSYYIQCLQDCLRYMWQHRTGNLYQSAWYGDYSAYSPRASFTRVRINVPDGITTVRVSFRGIRSAASGDFGVLTDGYSNTVASPASIGWAYIDVPVRANAPVNMFLQAYKTHLYGVSIYCVDPSY